MKNYNKIKDFYLFYLTQHSNPTNRRLHFAGTFFVVLVFVLAFFYNYKTFLLIPFLAFGFAWVGHFFIEKNKPIVFQYFFLSFFCLLIMCWHMLTNQIDKKILEAEKNINL